jgi:hypothetical protein
MPDRPSERIARPFEKGALDLPQCTRCFDRWQQLLVAAGVHPDDDALRRADDRFDDERRHLADVMQRIWDDST